MKILITGGAGFIGTHLQEHLKEHEVHVVDIVNGTDINDIKTWKKVYDKAYTFDCVIHMAAEANSRAVNKNPIDAVKTMTQGLVNVVTQFNKSHFIFLSSSMVYGDWPKDRDIVSESDYCKPIDLYGQLKLAGEGIVKLLHKNYTIIRPSAVYGNNDKPVRVISLWIKAAKKGQYLTVKGRNSQLDFTYVDDIVDGITRCMNKKNSKNETFNITHGEAVKLKKVADYIVKKIGKGNVVVEDHDTKYPKRGTLSTNRAGLLLDYESKYDFKRGIDEII